MQQLTLDFETPCGTWKQTYSHNRCDHPVCKYIKEDRRRWYHGYLQSDRWKQLRKVVIDLARGQCAHCGTQRATQVHHKSYYRIGYEEVDDLEALCDQCHALIHQAGDLTRQAA